MDQIDIEILEDGTISCKTNEISGTNHFSADEFLSEIEELAGGKRVTKQHKEKAHVHQHGKHTVHHSH